MTSKKNNTTKATTPITETPGPGETYKPTVRGSASICTWTLNFRFLTREQCVKFINLYLAEFEYASNVEYEMIVGDSLTKDEHWVSIEGSWANNLTKVGQLLEQCDYRMD